MASSSAAAEEAAAGEIEDVLAAAAVRGTPGLAAGSTSKFAAEVRLAMAAAATLLAEAAVVGLTGLALLMIEPDSTT